MSERGLPIDGAPACPFVAFEDDRDGRSTAPDHRHRCFAEPRPAPRALAHQEAYCLSSAFPVCPTFQDWARREAAAARPGAASRAETRDPGSSSQPYERGAASPQGLSDEALPPDGAQSAPPFAQPPGAQAKRVPQRDWAAPPPWIAEAPDGDDRDDPARYDGDDPGGYAGSDPGRYDADDPYAPAPDPYTAAPDDERYAPPARRPAPDDPGPPSFLAAKAAAPNDPSRGLSGSAADRFAGGDPYAPRPAEPSARPADVSARPQDPYARPQDPYARPASPDQRTSAGSSDDLDDWAGPGTAAVAAASARPSSASSGSSRQRYDAERSGTGRDPQPTSRRQPPPRDSRKAKDQDAQELFGPAWEPARRYEAYPSLRTRIGLPRIGGIPPLGLAALALVFAALALFFVGPMLLGIGGKDPGGPAATLKPAATEQATDSPEPTLAPEPTAQVYIIVKGDTISRIAKKFGISIEELLNANPKVKKNPDKIKPGQEITIPAPAGASSAAPSGDVTDGTVDASPTP